MDFIQDLNEAKLFGHSRTNLKRYNAKEIADLLFLHICALQIMKHEFLALPDVQAYVKRAGNVANFDYYIQSRNEIYILLHILIGKYAGMQQKMLKDQEASQEYLSQIKINVMLVRKYLRLIVAGKADVGFERRFLIELEKGLMISNSYLRSIRRLVMTWPTQPESNKRLVMTRILQLFRTRARRSELMPILEMLSKREKMEDKSLNPLEGEGPGQKTPAKKGLGFLKGLALAGGGALAGYHLTRRKRK